MFKESNPPLENPIEYFRERSDSDKEKSIMNRSFMQFYLPMERQREIINDVCEDYNIKGREKNTLSEFVHLSLPSPNTSKESWEKKQ